MNFIAILPQPHPLPATICPDPQFQEHLCDAIDFFRNSRPLTIDLRAFLDEDPLIQTIRTRYPAAKVVTQQDIETDAMVHCNDSYFAVVPLLPPNIMLALLGNFWKIMTLQNSRHAMYVHLNTIPSIFSQAPQDLDLLLPAGTIYRHRSACSSILVVGDGSDPEPVSLGGLFDAL